MFGLGLGLLYLLTFGLEVNFIWPSRWKLVRMLFTLTRYLPFVDTVLLLNCDVCLCYFQFLILTPFKRSDEFKPLQP